MGGLILLLVCVGLGSLRGLGCLAGLPGQYKAKPSSVHFSPTTSTRCCCADAESKLQTRNQNASYFKGRQIDFLFNVVLWLSCLFGCRLLSLILLVDMKGNELSNTPCLSIFSFDLHVQKFNCRRLSYGSRIKERDTFVFECFCI